ncbi:hypothetical protein Ccar_17980 [Clostridium carboxidivorans P7]|uniref:Uncharacterized protein n=2 Tax=Clostridium TaxID=1485 RepID=C6PZQ5_9CLOT|nr:hypothetical protein [Clostridium carboxidivorans]AKN34214.1 hypothetical protein Ccar_17980 [Clostridium carboxidivorans P7]EET85255.1 hypothetical protein CcarbDRAFT_4272 [Clostridium carboxidivorans P7]EFG90145.1 hypothetical protein CLCAR_0351 [Clostridium carboxidivorans P7]
MGLTDIRNPYENKEGEKFAETNTKDLPQTKTLKDELISLMIRRKIITNDDEINEDMLKMIEKSIETYAELNNSKKVK